MTTLAILPRASRLAPLWAALVLVAPTSAAAEERASADRDADGIWDWVDVCPDRAETTNGYRDDDGCPDVVSKADSDADGFWNAIDECPDGAETKNGYRDDDGCPDTPPSPEVVALLRRPVMPWRPPPPAPTEAYSPVMIGAGVLGLVGGGLLLAAGAQSFGSGCEGCDYGPYFAASGVGLAGAGLVLLLVGRRQVPAAEPGKTAVSATVVSVGRRSASVGWAF